MRSRRSAPRRSKRADIILVGGGSGGHLTPLVPIAEELHARSPALRIAHIGQRGDPLNSIVRSFSISQHYEVSAGRFRRYQGDSWLVRLFNVRDNLLNFRDGFRVIAGIYQSWVLLGRIKPRAMLAKGGYVGVPVGVAARLRRVPYVTHDSDAMVSLANRIIANGAKYHATAQHPDNYARYDKEKTVQVGVPVHSRFKEVTDDDKTAAKKSLGYKKESKLLLVVGGGLGARVINRAMVASAQALLDNDSNLSIIHITGHKLLSETEDGYSETISEGTKKRLEVIAFSDSMHILGAASDVVVTRAGATNMAELSSQAKACVVIPNPLLTGGHQSKNAKVYEEKKAAIVMQEEDLQENFEKVVTDLLSSASKQKSLGKKLHSLFVPGAAAKLADMLLEIAE